MAQLSNGKLLQQQAEALGEKVNRLDREDLPTVNVLVAGITGTGKSTLLNAVFGSELAKTGVGRPITENILDYQSPDNTIRIWDTVGFELDGEKTKRAIQAVRKTIADKASSSDQFDRIHAIWYCISEGANRYQDVEINFIKELHELDIPFIIVITQSLSGSHEYADTIRGMNQSMGIGEIDVIPVLAKDYSTAIGLIPAFGLEVLVHTTLDKLPELIKSGFIAAQRVNVVQKRSECEKIIFENATAALNGFWDKIPVLDLFATNEKINKMFKKICTMYNSVLSDEASKRVVRDLRVDWGKHIGWMVNPFRSTYDRRLKSLLDDMSTKEGLNVRERQFSDWERGAQMITFYGYNVMIAIEEIWNEATEEQLKDIDFLIRELSSKINKNLKKDRGEPNEYSRAAEGK